MYLLQPIVNANTVHVSEELKRAYITGKTTTLLSFYLP
jgi:hypothetical protein